MQKVLMVLNEMVNDKIISSYAIGGAVAATFYVEPISTFDLDVFVFFPEAKSGLLSISPLYSYLMARGHQPRGETIQIEDWPVQFLPAFNSLTIEALTESLDKTFRGVPTRVMSAEHLAAIMLDVGRPKDHARLIQFVEAGVLDEARLKSLLERHNLSGKWRSFRQRFLGEA